MIAKPLRKALKDTGLSIREISRQTGIDATLLSRFIRGDRTITLPTAEQLCKYLGMELTKRKRSHLTTGKK